MPPGQTHVPGMGSLSHGIPQRAGEGEGIVMTAGSEVEMMDLLVVSKHIPDSSSPCPQSLLAKAVCPRGTAGNGMPSDLGLHPSWL